MSSVPSLLMCVGEQYYKLWEFIDEAMNLGISKRLPLTGIPEGMVPGLSKIFVAHPKAIVKITATGCSLHDLGYVLVEEGLLTEPQFAKLVDLDKPFWTGADLQPNDFVPESMLDVTYAFSKLPEPRKSELTRELGLEFCMGVFGYSPFSSFQLVLDDHETELPKDLEQLATLVDTGYVEMVHVQYNDENSSEE